MKIFYFDIETTGLDPKKHDIVQLAYQIVIDDKVVEGDNIFMQPFDFSTIEQEALDVHGITIKKIKTFQEPQSAYKLILDILDEHIDKYDRSDKFQPAGYNIRFDLDFLKQFFVKNNDKYFGSWFNYRAIDPLAILYFMEGMGKIKLPNYKLETVCEHFGIEIDAHDALGDITATKQLVEHLRLQIKE